MDKRKNNQSLFIGMVGLIIQSTGYVAIPDILYALAVPHDLTRALSLGITVIGTGILIWGTCLYALAKERNGWWGLFGLLSIVGLLVLSTLEDRHELRMQSRHFQADISIPPNPGSIDFLCVDCCYILNGVVGTNCPECGRPFDPDDLSTVRFDNPNAIEKPPWTSRYSLMFGIISLVLFCIPLIGPLTAISAIICGHCALYTIKHKRKNIDAGVAIAGLVTGYLGLAVGIGVVVFIIIDG